MDTTNVDNLLKEGHEFVECDERTFQTHKGLCVCVIDTEKYGYNRKHFIAKPKVRKYDWSKTSIIVEKLSSIGMTKEWLYHDGGPCPFDPDSVFIDVRYRDGDLGTCVDPKDIDMVYWGNHDLTGSDIIAVRFNRLKPNVEW